MPFSARNLAPVKKNSAKVELSLMLFIWYFKINVEHLFLLEAEAFKSKNDRDLRKFAKVGVVLRFLPGFKRMVCCELFAIQAHKRRIRPLTLRNFRKDEG